MTHNDRFGQVLPNLYKSVFEELKIACVTDDMLEQCSQKDDIDHGWMLLYLIRRLLWRFAFASKRFALQMTETCYIDCLLSDLDHLSKTPLSNWNVMNQYFYLFNLECSFTIYFIHIALIFASQLIIFQSIPSNVG